MLPILLILVSTVSVSTISAQSQYEIPSWIKGVADFWIEEKITDKRNYYKIKHLSALAKQKPHPSKTRNKKQKSEKAVWRKKS